MHIESNIVQNKELPTLTSVNLLSFYEIVFVPICPIILEYITHFVYAKRTTGVRCDDILILHDLRYACEVNE